MKKEIIICAIVVILVIILEIVTGNYTKKSVEKLKSDLYRIKQEIDVGEKEKINNSVEEAKENWTKKANTLAYYVEHDEIEKVNLYLVGMETNVETEEYSEAEVELEKCVYILEHIEEKYSFKLKNIF